MNKRIWSKRLPGNVGISLFIALAAYFIWDGMTERGFWWVCAGISLILFSVAMLYLKRMDDQAEQKIAQRIKAEYLPKSQPQILEIYEHLKVKEREGLFSKILDDAKGNVALVVKLAAIAESEEWNAFLESKW
jgi:hypothetical protein